MMATKVYETKYITLLDNASICLTPLKIKYLREFMVEFEKLRDATSNEETIEQLAYCALICMKQFRPDIVSLEQLEDITDIELLYDIIEFSAGVKLRQQPEIKEESESKEQEGDVWESLDLAKLEAEVFILGIWKDYDELETSLSMPELVTTLSARRELDYEEKKFLAAMQGVDLDKSSGKEEKNAWEEMKARVFSNGQAASSDDVLALQGVNAQKAGFGIGMGLDYQKIS
jgi:hypothetical protein